MLSLLTAIMENSKTNNTNVVKKTELFFENVDPKERNPNVGFYLSGNLSLSRHVGQQHLLLLSQGVTALQQDKRDKKDKRNV